MLSHATVTSKNASVAGVHHCLHSYIMTRAVAPSTPRRSKRFQPVVAVTPSRHTSLVAKACTFTWSSNTTLERKTTADDLYDEETLDGDAEHEPPTTIFYDALQRISSPHPTTKGKSNAHGTTSTFAVGDTILVDTPSIYPTVRRPSIGVIISMWEIFWSGADDEDEQRGGQDHMRVRVHWFLRPTELASVRARRDHREASKIIGACTNY
jgi:origin recognition complex subunit 1